MNHAANITEIHKDDVVILRIHGKLDSPLSATLEKRAIELIDEGHTNILLNLAEVHYVNSCGLRTLLALKKQIRTAEGKFTVCTLNSAVMEIMKICGLDHVLEIARNEEEALRHF